MIKLLGAFFFLAIFVAPTGAAAQDMVFRGKPSEFEDFGYLVRGAAWSFTDDREIFVCWENPTEANARSRQWVEDQISKTWQRHTLIKFTGWQRCGERNTGIRILISDESPDDGPHVKAFGRHIDGIKAGMVLNDTFLRWSPECRAMIEACVRSIAVHEFGHALGFAHEQNRPDTPGECRIRHGQGQNKETMLTPYDPHSVMNYCNPEYNNNGELSLLDIAGAKKTYGTTR